MLATSAGVPLLDVAVLGIGDDGHTASLFPGETSVDVRDRLALDIAASPSLDREARLTVTVPVIERIRTVLVLAVGKAKHGPLQRVAAAEGALHDTPSRAIRGVVGSLGWILDEAAAAG
jgi:6-phosphogluconolactonase